MRILLPLLAALLPVASTLFGDGSGEPAAPALATQESPGRAARLEALLRQVAHDSTRGRRVGTPELREVAEFLATELASYGVEPAPGVGYMQPVPIARVGGRRPFALPSESLDFDTLPPDSILTREVNVVGVIPGTDRERREEYVVVGAHFDHVGVRTAVDGDSIYNGADDDGTGTVAVLEIARELATDPPERSVVILLATAEEAGLLGSRHYLEEPLFPLERTVADFQIEMIGRPDSLAGGYGRGWLTGYELTTMGGQLSRAGSPIGPDRRPEMCFFFRSDNVPFTRVGIPAHTLSSYNLHEDYHRPSDEVETVDFAHMASLVDAAVQAVRFLANGPRPDWNGSREEALAAARAACRPRSGG